MYHYLISSYSLSCSTHIRMFIHLNEPSNSLKFTWTLIHTIITMRTYNKTHNSSAGISRPFRFTLVCLCVCPIYVVYSFYSTGLLDVCTMFELFGQHIKCSIATESV